MRREIADFTELGRFLDQPFKTYSQGMQARLAFGIATAVQPEILIVDEILGAGDAYFFMRSVSRMRDLISNGATVLLVSHSLDQVVRFCEETIWIDRGRIVMRGESTEVVKAYEKFIRDQEERRLLARNRKARTEGYDAFDRESYTDEIRIELNGSCEVRELALVRDGSIDDRVAVGDAQDGDASQSALVVLEGNSWSEPLEDGGFSRRVKKGGARALFHLWFFYADSAYSVDITYRGGPATISVDRGGTRIGFAELPATEQFNTQRVGLDTGASSDARAVSRWPGEGSLVITDVQILDEDGRERAVFRPGETMRIAIRAEAREAGIFPVTAAATLYRQDGILISNHTSERLMLEMDAAEAHVLTLVLPALNLGDGRYVFSLALYRRLTPTENSEPYDLLDRSYEFEITGNTPFANGVFSHPALWKLEADHMPEAPSR
jgi:lipopolysaccharide transport system ATP-binding protein